MVRSIRKKGNAVLDTITVVVMLMIFGVAIVLGYSVFDEMNSEIQADSDLSNNSKTESQQMYDRYPAVLDSIFLLAFILLWVLGLLASYLIDANPIFYVILFVMLMFVIFLGAEMANTYFEITDDLGNTSFPMMNFIFDHLVAFIICIGITIAIVLYGKNKYLGGGA